MSNGESTHQAEISRNFKPAVFHRLHAAAHKTVHGARIGDIHMSLIHTCELNQVNPFEYYLALQQHAAKVKQDPARWLPWCYQQNIPPADTG